MAGLAAFKAACPGTWKPRSLESNGILGVTVMLSTVSVVQGVGGGHAPLQQSLGGPSLPACLPARCCGMHSL